MRTLATLLLIALLTQRSLRSLPLSLAATAYITSTVMLGLLADTVYPVAARQQHVHGSGLDLCL